MFGSPIRRVNEWEYLGVILSENFTLDADTARLSRALIKQSHSLYSNFFYHSGHMLSYLFRTYTSSFYGAETWYSFKKASVFNVLAVVYHKCVKKVEGLNIWDSNYEACEIVKVPIFKYMLAKRLVSFLFKVLRC